MRLPVLASLLLASACLAGPILPKPVRVNLIMDAPATNIRGAKVEADPAFAATAERLRAQLGTGGTSTVQLVKATGPVRGFEVGEEGYVIEAHPGQPVRIHARTEAGAFYGIVSLQQHAYTGNDGGTYVPPGDVMDKPRFAWRGLMIDDGRHIMGKAQILRMLDLMALHKLNTLHWHLTEDQGWRVEIKKYPKLTEVGSQRDASPTMGNRNKPDGKPYGGFYTQEDLKEVVAYATKLHINVIPEIEMPGHAAAAIAAYPNLGNTDIPGYSPKVATSWGVKYYTFAPKEETFAFIDDIFAELCPIFPNAFFHIGGDEAPKDQWNKSPFAKEVMAKQKLKDTHELQSYFISRVEKLLNKRGKRLIGWDEIQEGGLSKTATMMVWRDWKWAQLAADRGNNIVMAPTSHTYFDYGQGKHPANPAFDTIGGNLTVEKVYGFEPIPPKFTEAQRKLVLGCQAQLWGEYIYNPAKQEYMAFPRACALAEVAWSENKDRSWAEFQPRLEAHLKRLDTLKVNYRRPDGTPAVTEKVGRGE
jgi:hexosaminidase